MAGMITLDATTREVLVASYTLPDLETAVQQVIYNCIDAHAKAITLLVDIANASFTVVDDGDGIEPDDLYNYIGECHASSRFQNTAPNASEQSQQKAYGSRGALLYELVSLAATVEIESRVQEHWTSYRKVFKEREVIFNARSKELREAPGTKVVVSHLFGKLPVRCKDLSRNAKHRAQVAQSIQNFCVNMSMIWPSLSFDVRFEDEGVRSVRITAAKSCRERFLESFGQVLGHELRYVNFMSKTLPFSIRGYFAFIPVGSEGLAHGIKQAKTYYQFAFLENEWVQECQQACSRVITEAALESLSAIPIFVLKIAAPREQYDTSRVEKDHSILFKSQEQFDQFLGRFVQNLAATGETQTECSEESHRKGDSYHEPTHSEASDHGVQHSTAASELFVGAEARYAPISEYPSQADSVVLQDDDEPTSQDINYGICAVNARIHRLDHDLDLQDQSQVSLEVDPYVGRIIPFEEQVDSAACSMCQACGHVTSTSTATISANISQEYNGDTDYELINSNSDGCRMSGEVYDNCFICTDPCENDLADVFFSGCDNLATMAQLENTDIVEEIAASEPWISSKPDTYDCADAFFDLYEDDSCDINPQRLSSPSQLRGDEQEIETSQEPCEVVDEMCDDFAVKPSRRISASATKSRYFTGSTVRQITSNFSRRGDVYKAAPVDHLAAALRVDNVHNLKGLRQIKISRTILDSLQVVRQVDRKFILARSTTPQGTLLLCIDQHAADERVRLEKLETDMFGLDGSRRDVEVHEHEPPLVLLMNGKERDTLHYNHKLIESWGFAFECISSNPEPGLLGIRDAHKNPRESRVLLYTTPKVEKRVANADDFREFIQLLVSSSGCTPYSNIRPPVITRLLHSRACRSAIMFGDWMSIGQCNELIEELKTCQLPFQCAHGRPSVVPLAEIINNNSPEK